MCSEGESVAIVVGVSKSIASDYSRIMGKGTGVKSFHDA